MADRHDPTLSDMADALSQIEAGSTRVKATARFGPRAFGHLHDRTGVVDGEAALIREAAGRVLAGETQSSVVNDWNGRGIRTVTGRPWRVNSLSALLIQPRLAGYQVDESGRYVQTWPAILDETTHHRLVALRSSRGAERRRPRPSLLTGLLRCGRCGGTLHYVFRKESAQYYRCPAPAAGGCSGVTIRAAAVEDYVHALVLERLDAPEFLESAVAALDAGCAGRPARDIADDIAHDRSALQQLARLWAGKEITRLEWQQARRDIARRLEQNDRRITALDALAPMLRLAGQGEAVAAGWSEMADPERRAVIWAVLDGVVVEPVDVAQSRRDRMWPIWRQPGATDAPPKHPQ